MVDTDQIKQCTLVISAVSVVSGVLISLLPKSSHKNLYKTITGLVLIYAFMMPVIGQNVIDFNFEDFLHDNYSVSSDIDKYALASIVDSAEKAIENIMNDEARKQNIQCEFRCRCEISDNQLAIEKISVKSDLNESERERVKNIAESFGFDKSSVEFEGEDNEYR